MSVCAKFSAVYLLIAIGFCGGFTTFSTFSTENLALLRAGNYGTAALYIAASVILSLLFVWLGTLVKF